MATIETGILGVTRGKIANVVGAKWKQTNYIRKLTTPANPKSEAQVIQRGKLAALVYFVKPLIAPLIHPFVDPFQKSQSGYNRFIQVNMPFCDEYGITDEQDLIYTEGQLTAINIQGTTNIGDVLTWTWHTEYGINGKPTDLVMIGSHLAGEQTWYWLPTPVLRSEETASMTCIGHGIGTSYAVAITYSETVSGRLLMVSHSVIQKHTP
jgi:hypothetical protein